MLHNYTQKRTNGQNEASGANGAVVNTGAQVTAVAGAIQGGSGGTGETQSA